MLRNSRRAEVKSEKGKVKSLKQVFVFAFCLFTFALASGCRYDMQDQPRYKAYKESDFFADKRASRDLPDGTVARGKLKDNKAFYTGKIDNPNLNAPVQTITDASGNTLVASFPNDIDEFPVPVTKELVDRGRVVRHAAGPAVRHRGLERLVAEPHVVVHLRRVPRHARQALI